MPDATTTTARTFRWTDLPKDHPMDRLSRRRIIGEHMMLSEVRLEKGCMVPTHAHANEQIACVVSGRVKFGIGADDDPARKHLTVGAGEVLLLPPNVPHSAEALEESLVLDLFSPVSEKTGIDRG